MQSELQELEVLLRPVNGRTYRLNQPALFELFIVNKGRESRSFDVRAIAGWKTKAGSGIYDSDGAGLAAEGTFSLTPIPGEAVRIEVPAGKSVPFPGQMPFAILTGLRTGQYLIESFQPVHVGWKCRLGDAAVACCRHQ